MDLDQLLDADVKSLEAECRRVLGTKAKQKLPRDVDDILDAADELDEDQAEAAGALRRYARLAFPDDLRAGLQWAYHLDYTLGDHERALAETLAVLEQFPNSADANQTAAFILMRTFQQFDRALPYITRAVELNPLEGTCWFMLAWAQAGRGEPESGVAAALEALECDRRAVGGADDEETRIFAHMYLYLFGPETEREVRLAELAADVQRGESAEDFGVPGLAARARESGHAESEWLEQLAQVAEGKSKPGSLKAWPAYTRAKDAAKRLPKWRAASEPDEPYHVDLISPPAGHHVPRLLHEFGRWLAGQEHGNVGWFDGLVAESLEDWPMDDIARIAAGALAIVAIGDGSRVVLVSTGADTPPAVGYLDSEGDSHTLANSLEEFIILWSRGETTVGDLDDEEAKKGRKALAQWVAARGLSAPARPNFDFNAWLDSGNGYPSQTATPSGSGRSPTAVFAKLGPKAQQLAAMIGLRADAPELVQYVTEMLGKKVPASTRRDDLHVTAPKLGVELSFSHKIHADAYPPIAKTKNSFVPYLALAWLNPKLGEELLGVSWKNPTLEALSKRLGPPTFLTGSSEPVWVMELDSSAHTELRFDLESGELSVTLAVAQARALEEFPDASTGLFVGYAAERGLLDPDRFEAHAELLRRVAAREAQGSELIARALGRGLWDDHLKDDAELRTFTFGWFHNIGKVWITRDLIKVFGKREGPYGHDEPVLDDDTWAAVDEATPIFDQRLAAWL